MSRLEKFRDRIAVVRGVNDHKSPVDADLLEARGPSTGRKVGLHI